MSFFIVWKRINSIIHTLIKNRRNKKNLGKSIEERPKGIDTREEFDHWEIDSVIGQKKEG